MVMAHPALDMDLSALFGGGCRARLGRLESAYDESHLHEAELSVIARAVSKRRREFSMGRLLARELLAEWGIAGFTLLPDEDRCPIWPKGITGSVSHCETLCGVVVASSDSVRSVGLDVESDTALEGKLVERICRPEELEGLAPQERASQAKILFSIKEAVYKCQFPLSRTFLGFHDVCVELEDDGFRARIREEKAAALASPEIRGRFARHAGHVFSAARLDH